MWACVCVRVCACMCVHVFWEFNWEHNLCLVNALSLSHTFTLLLAVNWLIYFFFFVSCLATYVACACTCGGLRMTLGVLLYDYLLRQCLLLNTELSDSARLTILWNPVSADYLWDWRGTHTHWGFLCVLWRNPVLNSCGHCASLDEKYTP